MEPNFIKIEHQIDNLLKEIKELKENQKVMSEKMNKMQQVIDHIESDIYIDENTIELDWTGDLDEDDDEGCSGHCHGCSGCND